MYSKVLIVDDEAHIRLLIQQTLEEIEDQGGTAPSCLSRLDDAPGQWLLCVPHGQARVGDGGYVHCDARGQRAGVRQAKGQRSRRGYIHDQAVRCGRPACQGA